MYPVHLSLVATEESSPDAAGAQLVQDVLWAHATSRHGLEHVRVRGAADGADAVLFIRAGTSSEAITQARELVAEALARAGLLSQYAATLQPVE